MFGGTIWAMVFQRTNDQVNCKTLLVACTLLLFSTAVCVSLYLRIGIGRDWTDFSYTASRDRYDKDHGGFDIVPRHFLRRTCWVFLAGVSLDVRVQELCVHSTDAHRGWCRCEFSLGSEISYVNFIVALPLLCSMAI